MKTDEKDFKPDSDTEGGETIPYVDDQRGFEGVLSLLRKLAAVQDEETRDVVEKSLTEETVNRLKEVESLRGQLQKILPKEDLEDEEPSLTLKEVLDTFPCVSDPYLNLRPAGKAQAWPPTETTPDPKPRRNDEGFKEVLNLLRRLATEQDGEADTPEEKTLAQKIIGQLEIVDSLRSQLQGVMQLKT